MDYTTLAYILMAIGLVLMVAELFLPTGGVLIVLGAGCMLTAVAIAFFFGDSTAGMYMLVGTFAIVPALSVALLYVWPRLPMVRRMTRGADADATVATMPVNVELEQLRGRYGRAVSTLRPAGVVDFDGRRIDTMTEGMMIEPGQWVRCIDVKAGKVIVRQVDPPNLDTLERADFS